MAERPGASFEDADVVENYRFRPPYPAGIFQRLVEISPARGSALDIGCGPGKISRVLAGKVDRVTAVDPSQNMIALGRSLSGGSATNIEWLEGFAEHFPIGGRNFDLTVAAASIHWQAGSGAMGFEMSGIDHQIIRFTALGCQFRENAVEHTKSAPADKAVVDGLVRP